MDHVSPWHCDNERLFGSPFEPKVIVSMSLGHSVLFKLRSVARRRILLLKFGWIMVTYWSWMVSPNWRMSTLRRLNWRDLGLISRTVGYHSFGRPGNMKLLLICANGKGFEVVLGLIFTVLINCLFLLIFEERDKMLLRAILSGGVWNGFLLCKVEKEDVPCRFCGAPDNDGHLFLGLHLPSLR